MANTYSWSFPSFTVYPNYAGQQNVVCAVSAIYQGNDGSGHQGCVNINVGLTYIEGEPFTPFDQLNQNQVEQWCVAAIGNETLISYQASIDAQIQQQVSPIIIDLPPPWQPA